MGEVVAALIGAIASLAGAILGTVGTLATLRANRRAQRRQAARPAVEQLQVAFVEHLAFIDAERSIVKSDPNPDSVFDDDWASRSTDARKNVDRVVNRRARDSLLVMVQVLDNTEMLNQRGAGRASTVREEKWHAANDGAKIASAVLQETRFLGVARRTVRKLRGDLDEAFEERAELGKLAMDKERTPTGVIRKPLRALKHKIKRRWQIVVTAGRKWWDYLFHP